MNNFFKKYGNEPVAKFFELIPGSGSRHKDITIEELYQAFKSRLEDEKPVEIEEKEEIMLDVNGLTEEGQYYIEDDE